MNIRGVIFGDFYIFCIFMIENKIKKAVYAADLYKEWSGEDINIPFSSIEYQYQELQEAGGIDKDGNVIENEHMEVDVAKELVRLYQFCKENKVDVVIL